MALAPVFLPLLLPEPPTTVQQSRGRKRTVFKPSVFESMANFIDIQKVCYWSIFASVFRKAIVFKDEQILLYSPF